MLKTTLILSALFAAALLTACSSSSANHPAECVECPMLQSQISALENRVDEQAETINQLFDAVGSLPRFQAGRPNPVQIAGFYPIYFDATGCQGRAFVGVSGTRHDISRTARRQGVAFRYTLPGQERGAPETYSMVPPGSEFTNIEYFSRLNGPGSCAERTGTAVGVIPVSQQTDPEAYEEMTGVPAGGFLEGRTLSAYTAPDAQGMLGARFYDFVSGTGFMFRLDADDVPLVIE